MEPDKRKIVGAGWRCGYGRRVDLPGYAAVVLAGGAARRLGGVRKPALAVAGRSMLDRVLSAVSDAAVRVVVGPADLPVPAGVRVTLETPPGGGPVAGTAAGLALVPADVPLVALLAADLPLLRPEAVNLLRARLAPPAGPADLAAELASAAPADPAAELARAGPADPADPAAGLSAALFVDAAGRRQSLCGVWRAAALRARLAELVAERGGLAGASMRALLAGAPVADVSWPAAGPPPWFDCDTDADLRNAEGWAR